MRNRLKIMGAVALSLPVLAVTTAAEAQQVPSETETCAIETTSKSIPVSTAPFVLQATLSEAIGDSVAVSFPEESRVRVVSVKRDEAEPLALHVTLNTSEAVAGEWAVAVVGEAGRCVGDVMVVAVDTPGGGGEAPPTSPAPELPGPGSPDLD